MSETQVPAVAAPVQKPLTAIQIIEAELVNFEAQRERVVASVHAVEGAIQASQHLLGKLKNEAAKALAALVPATPATPAPVATEVVAPSNVVSIESANKQPASV